MPKAPQQSEKSSIQQVRLEDELSMLEAIYPGQVRWLDPNQEIVYSDEDGAASLVLRLPNRYLLDTLPEVITATCRKSDLRDQMKSLLAGQDPETEMLDAIIEEFRRLTELVEDVQDEKTGQTETAVQYQHHQASLKATVVVWLHHLLNTNKRKQASSPPSSEVAGFTKPGYPGVLLFTGDAADVHAHVQELKALNWQAFQVRLECNVEWGMPHRGVVEVESIGEIASALDEAHKEEFLSAMRIK